MNCLRDRLKKLSKNQFEMNISNGYQKTLVKEIRFPQFSNYEQNLSLTVKFLIFCAHKEKVQQYIF
jgi:hypothetical protein